MQAQVFCGSSKAENKVVAVSAKTIAEKSPVRRKPPATAARPSPPRASMGQLQSRRSGGSGDSKPTHDEKPQAGHAVENQAKNIAPHVSPQPKVDKQSDALDTFGEEDASCNSTLSGEEEPQATAFNQHCSALPDVPCNKGEQTSPKVFSVTFHTTSTSYLQPSDQQVPSSKRAVARVRLPSDCVVTGISCLPGSQTKSTEPEVLRPWTKSYSPVKQPPATVKASGATVTSLNVPDECKPPASENSSTITGSQEKLRLQAHHTPALDRILVGTESSKEDIAKPEDTAKPKPILKKHEDTSVHSEPKPILKRKSVDEEAEDRLKPILKNQQQRRWSHEHSPDKGDTIVVRRRSHSTELETKPVLSFVESAGSASAVRTGSVSVSKVVSCPPLDSTLGHRGTGLQADISPHGAVVEVSLGSERPITLRSPSVSSSPEDKRYFRRNASCYKTQPVTASEIKATDSLESVRSFRNLVLKEASLSIFNKEAPQAGPTGIQQKSQSSRSLTVRLQRALVSSGNAGERCQLHRKSWKRPLKWMPLTKLLHFLNSLLCLISLCLVDSGVHLNYAAAVSPCYPQLH
ncbi:hypothetical protein MRX96_027156 [Rhipicephalus microplus]